MKYTLKEKVASNVRKQLQEKGLGRRLREVNLSYNPYLRLELQGKQEVTELFNELYQGVYRDKKQKLLNLEVLVANLVGNKKKFFAISRNPNYWKRNQYRETTYHTVKLMDIMTETGFIEQHKGKGNEDPKLAYDTKIRATDKLLSYMQILPDQVKSEPPLIEVRSSENNKRLPYKETQKINKIKERLRTANKVNSSADIRHKDQPLDTSLVAIFKDKTSLYGRLHTKGSHHYQGLGEDERAEITINGESVIELDYSALHPYLLYAKEGKQFSGDPYLQVLSDPRFRGFLKECFLPLINVTGGWTKGEKKKSHWRSARQNFISGVNERLYKDKAIRKTARDNNRPLTKDEKTKVKERKAIRHALEDIGITSGEQILDAWIEAHKPISHYFCTDDLTGKKLMNLDAQIALDVVNYFAKQGIPILAIHDSFIVQESYRDDLKRVMHWSYEKHTNGFRIEVK